MPEPVAARVDRHWVSYEARILTRRISGARPLPEVQNLDDEALWYEVGRTVRRFHDTGLDHVDLNVDNILIVEGKVYLIDFDRCRLRTTMRDSGRWRYRNLARLKRSMIKRCGDRGHSSVARFWKAFYAGYGRRD